MKGTAEALGLLSEAPAELDKLTDADLPERARFEYGSRKDRRTRFRPVLNPKG
jgi:hypothetical protein